MTLWLSSSLAGEKTCTPKSRLTLSSFVRCGLLKRYWGTLGSGRSFGQWLGLRESLELPGVWLGSLQTITSHIGPHQETAAGCAYTDASRLSAPCLSCQFYSCLCNQKAWYWRLKESRMLRVKSWLSSSYPGEGGLESGFLCNAFKTGKISDRAFAVAPLTCSTLS